MTEKDIAYIKEKLEDIHNCLAEEEIKFAFYHLGKLYQFIELRGNLDGTSTASRPTQS